ncbi:MAG: SDR family NAD(P)-dependent oxidoreductase [Bryobacterales bacterium]|nr:SDR family NAD(P)-dependent oxidoreductase [Bryobacterales bacterium]
MNPAELKGKTALVTGGNHGIGAAIARALGAHGANVFVTYFRPATPYSKDELRTAQSAGIGGDALYHAHQQQTPEHIVSSVKSAGGRAAMLELDLSASESVSAVLDACEAEFGHCWGTQLPPWQAKLRDQAGSGGIYRAARDT